MTDAAVRGRWVRVWFVAMSEHNTDTLVGSYRATDETIAKRYAEALRGSHGLRVTIDPLPAGTEPVRDIPAEQLWTLAP